MHVLTCVVLVYFLKQQPGQTNNLTDLENLTEDTLLLELTVRYKDDVIYTYVGDILCAINPFKTIPDLYSSAKAKQYAGLTSLADLPPHIFASADAAFTNMVSASSAANVSHHAGMFWDQRMWTCPIQCCV